MDELTPTEQRALRAIGTTTWRLNELPPGVTGDELDSLDTVGLLEFRAHGVGTTTNLHGKKVVCRTPSPLWLSPAKDRGEISSVALLLKQAGKMPEEAAEVRANSKGKRTLQVWQDAANRAAQEKWDKRSREDRDRQNQQDAEALRSLMAQPLIPERAVELLLALAELRPGEILPRNYDAAAAVVVKMSRLGIFKEYPTVHRYLCAHDAGPIGHSLIGCWGDFSSAIRQDKGLPKQDMFSAFPEDTRLATEIIGASLQNGSLVAATGRASATKTGRVPGVQMGRPRLSPAEQEARVQSIRECIRDLEAKGEPLDRITRDRVSSITGVPTGSVSFTEPWRALAARKAQGRAKARPTDIAADNIADAIERGDWERVERFQRRESGD